MSAWQWLLDSAGVVLLVVIGYGLLLVVRRRLLSRHGGTFELSARIGARGQQPEAGRGWVLGLGRYRDERLEWFRIFSPSPWPRRSWERANLRITGQREPTGQEAFALYGGHLVVVCSTPKGAVELAMSPSALTGFSSWLESGPPGSDWDRRRAHH
ncbi:DUF2550 domain-containing protein [Nocardioides pocheonensis]|jgi:hypothetical protein|uniref:DUF2550 family protein n=1 Tax=Nocardioides pocheonensis TaxID=661485 RepID=A0A3N0GSC8_9ACTN|nr:DUF2550 domain-containing protein [Nocardioides pocheonensis]RNM15301.1 DUF2550 family protein [Nocardioides pocheonensis]